MLTRQRNKWLQNLVGLGTYDQNDSPLATYRIIGMSILMGSSLAHHQFGSIHWKR